MEHELSDVGGVSAMCHFPQDGGSRVIVVRRLGWYLAWKDLYTTFPVIPPPPPHHHDDCDDDKNMYTTFPVILSPPPPPITMTIVTMMAMIGICTPPSR